MKLWVLISSLVGVFSSSAFAQKPRDCVDELQAILAEAVYETITNDQPKYEFDGAFNPNKREYYLNQHDQAHPQDQIGQSAVLIPYWIPETKKTRLYVIHTGRLCHLADRCAAYMFHTQNKAGLDRANALYLDISVGDKGQIRARAGGEFGCRGRILQESEKENRPNRTGPSI